MYATVESIDPRQTSDDTYWFTVKVRNGGQVKTLDIPPEIVTDESKLRAEVARQTGWLLHPDSDTSSTWKDPAP
jgi:hypothetical protein